MRLPWPLELCHICFAVELCTLVYVSLHVVQSFAMDMLLMVVCVCVQWSSMVLLYMLATETGLTPVMLPAQLMCGVESLYREKENL